MVYANQSDAKKGAALKAFLTFVSAPKARSWRTTIDYAPLSKDVLAKAKAQLSKIVVPAT